MNGTDNILKIFVIPVNIFHIQQEVNKSEYQYMSDLSPINTRQINTLVALVFIVPRGVFCLMFVYANKYSSSISIIQRHSL